MSGMDDASEVNTGGGDSVRISSYPVLHHLSPEHNSGCHRDLRLVPAEGCREAVYTHQVLFGAALPELRPSLLDHRVLLLEQDVVTIVMPDFSREQVEVVLQVITGSRPLSDLQDKDVEAFLLSYGIFSKVEKQQPVITLKEEVKAELSFAEEDEEWLMGMKGADEDDDPDYMLGNDDMLDYDDDDLDMDDDIFYPDISCHEDDASPGQSQGNGDDDDSDADYLPPSSSERRRGGRRGRKRRATDQLDGRRASTKAKQQDEEEFSCHVCDFTANAKRMRIHYRRTHPKVAPDPCSFCTTKIYPPLMSMHLEQHRRVEELKREKGTAERVSCAQCQTEVYRTSLTMHYQRNHPELSFKEVGVSCPLCAHKMWPEKVASHMEKHKGGGGKCSKCSRYIWSKEALEQHQKWHDQKALDWEQQNIEKLKKGHKPVERYFCCAQCGKELPIGHMKSHMEEHLAHEREKRQDKEERKKRRAETTTMCEKCGKDVPYYGYKQHAKNCKGLVKALNPLFKFDFKLNPENPSICIIEDCNFVEPSAAKMKIHYGRNHVRRPCPECHAVFALHSLREHIYNIHGKTLAMTNSHTCDICEKTFPYKYHLKMHMEEDHIKELKHFCETCGKGFYTRRKLTLHAYDRHIRGNRKPYCEVCGLTVKFVKQIKEHLKEVHKMELPYNYKPPFKDCPTSVVAKSE